MVTAPARGGRGPEGRGHSRHDGRHPSAAIRPGSGPDAIVAAARDAEALGFADILGRDGARVCGAPRAGAAEGREQPSDGTYHKGGAKSPGPGQSGDDDGPVLGGGIDGGGKHTGSDTDDAAEEGEQDSFEEELDADVALGGT